MKRIIVSRPFTIYQLANLITYELPDVIRKFETKIIIISDILRMFLEDAQVRIEARPIIKEITISLRKFSNDTSVIVSLNCTPPSPYSQMLLPRFDKCIQVINDEFDGRLIAEIGYRKKKESKIIRLQQLDLEIIHQR